jgi:epoxide hydrolase-like predicted phosphatase
MDRNSNIRAVIFDLGGVLLRTEDPQPRLEMAGRLGLTRQELENAVFNHPASQQAERGLITGEQAWRAVTQALGVPASEIPAFRKQFFAGDRVDFALIEFIQKLRTRVTTALLSNSWIADLPTFLAEDLQIVDTFDVVVSSAKVKVAKPDPAIFRLVLEAVQASPDEAVFVDDFENNITAAAMLGIRTVQFRDAAQAEAALAELLGLDEDPGR